MIITIDGPGGVGKSTLAKRLAYGLNFEVLDTGAMFRAVAYFALKNGYSGEDLEKGGLLSSINILAVQGGCFLNGEDISSAIRTPEIDLASSRYSTFPYVRQAMKGLQQAFAEGQSIVAEGRDMGSQVFPQADFKFYLDASPEVRARRRRLQLLEKGIEESLEKILAEINERDERDKTRSAAPLIVPQGAYVIDTGGLSLEETFNSMLNIIKKGCKK